MSQKPRCKKCGRVLRDPVSIARGMGPVCAGDTGRSGRRPQVRARRSAGRAYDRPRQWHAAITLTGSNCRTT